MFFPTYSEESEEETHYLEENQETPETIIYRGDFDRSGNKMLLKKIPHISELMTEYLGSDPTSKENISWLASFTQLFDTNPKLIATARGGYNKVSIYQTNTGKYGVRRYAVRQNINKFLPLGSRNLLDYVQRIRRSMDIIKQASDQELSPPVYYIGFANFNTSGGHTIGVAQFSEAYDMDLSTYYHKRVQRWLRSDLQVLEEDENDRIISAQIIDLISRMVKKLHLSCFDIKPGNCVINVGPPLLVKLIDWDEDFCIDTPAARKIEGEMAEKIILLQIILMANHFYNTFDHNNLHDYVKAFVNFENISALSALFCGDINSTASHLLYDFTMYQRQSMYYFFKDMYHDKLLSIPAVWDSYLQPNITQGLQQTSFLRHGVFIDLIKNAMRLKESDVSANDKFIELGILEKPLRNTPAIKTTAIKTTRKSLKLPIPSKARTLKDGTLKARTLKAGTSKARTSKARTSKARKSPSAHPHPRSPPRSHHPAVTPSKKHPFL